MVYHENIATNHNVLSKELYLETNVERLGTLLNAEKHCLLSSCTF